MMDSSAASGHSGVYGNGQREKKLQPSSKVLAKMDMAQSLVNNMSSSMQSAACEEDVSSSYVDTDKPHMMSINPSLTYSAAGV